jgi:hypothetical protein
MNLSKTDKSKNEKEEELASCSFTMLNGTSASLTECLPACCAARLKPAPGNHEGMCFTDDHSGVMSDSYQPEEACTRTVREKLDEAAQTNRRFAR